MAVGVGGTELAVIDPGVDRRRAGELAEIARAEVCEQRRRARALVVAAVTDRNGACAVARDGRGGGGREVRVVHVELGGAAGRVHRHVGVRATAFCDRVLDYRPDVMTAGPEGVRLDTAVVAGADRRHVADLARYGTRGRVIEHDRRPDARARVPDRQVPDRHRRRGIDAQLRRSRGYDLDILHRVVSGKYHAGASDVSTVALDPQMAKSRVVVRLDRRVCGWVRQPNRRAWRSVLAVDLKRHSKTQRRAEIEHAEVGAEDHLVPGDRAAGAAGHCLLKRAGVRFTAAIAHALGGRCRPPRCPSRHAQCRTREHREHDDSHNPCDEPLGSHTFTVIPQTVAAIRCFPGMCPRLSRRPKPDPLGAAESTQTAADTRRDHPLEPTTSFAQSSASPALDGEKTRTQATTAG